MLRRPNKRKTPLTFARRGGAENQGSKTKASARRIRRNLPWHNPLPYPRVYLGLVYPSRRQVSVGGDEAWVMQELLQRGGTSSLHTTHPNLKRVIQTIRRRHRLRIMQRTRRIRGRAMTQYWLLDKVHWHMRFSQPVKGRKR